MKFRTVYVKKKLKYGFIGMNKYAAKKLKVPFKYKKPSHTIVVYKKVPKRTRLHTKRHEELEAYLMKNKRHSYHRAHKKALKFEDKGIPFPHKNTSKVLKKMKII